MNQHAPLMSPTTFRILVLASPLLSIASVAIDILLPELGPKTASTSDTENSLFDMGMLGTYVLLPWAFAGLVGLAGLLFFKRWARTLCVVWTLVGLGLQPFFGPSEASGWSNALNEASFTLWGAALALSFYGPIRERFAARMHAANYS